MSALATLHIDGRIARVGLNRADKRNALSIDLLDALRARIDDVSARTDVSVCIITGEGPTFCAGMDLKAVLNEPGAPARLLSGIAELTIAIRTMPQVTLARVNGAAIGGGCGLACVCDVAVTHPDAKLGFPEVDLGVCPAVVAPWLVAAIGAGAARRILLQGGTMTGLRAFELGMVGHCVPAQELDAKTADIAQRLAAAGPGALRVTKNLLNEIDGPRLFDLVRKGAVLSAQVVEGEEARAMLSKKLGG
jgi:methylglutaconyl-CoA hydratase